MRRRPALWRVCVATAMVAILVLTGAAVVFAAGRPRTAADPSTPHLAAAAGFSVLASSTVGSSGDTTVTGDVGTWPGTSITGFPPAEISNGATHSADASAQAAESAAATAYAELSALSGDAADVAPSDLTVDVNGGPITPGVYTFSDSAALSGTIELGLTESDDPNGTIVFLVPGDLTTASGMKMKLSGGLKSDHVFWQVQGSADLGSGSTFVGSVIASQGITLGEGTRLFGKAISLGDRVTLDAGHVDGVNAVASIGDDSGDGGTDGSGDASASPASGSSSTGTLPATGEDDPATTALPVLLSLSGFAALAGGLMLSRRTPR